MEPEQELPPAMDPGTLDLLYERARDSTLRQFEAARDLDGKTTQALGAATVLLGLASISHPGGVPAGAVAVTSFLVVAGAAGVGLWVRKFAASHSITHDWDEFAHGPVATAKERLVVGAERDYAENAKILRTKANAHRVALGFLCVEALAIGAGLIASAA